MARLFRKLSTLRENPGSTNTRKACAGSADEYGVAARWRATSDASSTITTGAKPRSSSIVSAMVDASARSVASERFAPFGAS